MSAGPIRTRLSLANDVVIPAGRALTEITWLYPWVMVAQTQAPGPTQLGFGELFILPRLLTWCARATEALPWRFPYNRVPLVPAALLALVTWLHLTIAPSAGWEPLIWIRAITIPDAADIEVTAPALFAFWVLGLYLVTRGLLIGLYAPTVAQLFPWFIGGMAAFIALFAVFALDQKTANAASVERFQLLIVAYVIVSLGLIALVHAQTLTVQIGRQSAVSLSWLFAILLPMICVVGLAILFADSRSIVRAIMGAIVIVALFVWGTSSFQAPLRREGSLPLRLAPLRPYPACCVCSRTKRCHGWQAILSSPIGRSCTAQASYRWKARRSSLPANPSAMSGCPDARGRETELTDSQSTRFCILPTCRTHRPTACSGASC
jgi:hypothetical protein